MIVRISGTGQFEIPDDRLPRLQQLDEAITAAVHSGDEETFHKTLHELVQFVKAECPEVPDETVVPSQLILPPEDITLEEAQRFFHDEDLLRPVEA